MVTVEQRVAQATLSDDGRPREPRPRRRDKEAERRQIDAILEKIRMREKALQPLWDRMDADLLRYELDPFKPLPRDGIAPEDAYTSNQPRTDADKIKAIVGLAPALIRVQSETDGPEFGQNDVDSNAERVAIGMLRLGDENLDKVGQTLFQQTLAHNAIVRGGWAACRALLTKRNDGSTKVNLTPIDPRQLVFQMGSDGLLWAALITMRNRASIKDEYDFKFTDEQRDVDDNDQQEKVIDYYRKEKGEWMNSVIVASESAYAKPPANTFAVEDPIVIRAIGSNPGNASFSLTQGATGGRTVQGLEGFGESIFAANRGIYDSDNRVKSILTSNLAKQNAGIYKTTSRGGEFALEEPPEKSGQVTLNSDMDEDVVLLDLPAIQGGALTNMSFINTDKIAGGTPPSAEGIASGQSSGRALTILNASLGDTSAPYARAVQSCMLGAMNALLAQYETGRYKAVHVTGHRLDNEGFSREIPPQAIQGRGPLSVELIPVLPEDDQAKWQMAMIARQPDPTTGRPLVSDMYINEHVSRVQDPKLEERRIDRQMARVANEQRLLETQLEAALHAGDQILVESLMEDLRRLNEQQFMEDMARRFAFAQAMGQDPLQTAAQGMGGPMGGTGVVQQQGSQPSPTNGLAPTQFPLSGQPLGGPQQGAVNTTANAGVPRPNAQQQPVPGLELS